LDARAALLAAWDEHCGDLAAAAVLLAERAAAAAAAEAAAVAAGNGEDARFEAQLELLLRTISPGPADLGPRGGARRAPGAPSGAVGAWGASDAALAAAPLPVTPARRGGRYPRGSSSGGGAEAGALPDAADDWSRDAQELRLEAAGQLLEALAALGRDPRCKGGQA
jgi:hypothetical protein